jgi:hypothetical protein
MSKTLGDHIFTIICHIFLVFFLIIYIILGLLEDKVMSNEDGRGNPASTSREANFHDPSEPIINNLEDLRQYEQARANTERRAACLLLEAPLPKPTIGKPSPKPNRKRTTITNLPGEIIESIVSYLPNNKVDIICLALTNRYMYSTLRSIIKVTIPKFYENPNNCPVCRIKKEKVLEHLRWMWRPANQDDLRQDVVALAKSGLDRSHHFHREYEILLRRLVRDGWVVRKRFIGYRGPGGQ